MTSPRPDRDPSWRIALPALMAGVAAVLVLYGAGFASLVAVWSSTVAYRFLFLVPPLSLYFLWLRWPSVRVLAPRPSPAGLLCAVPFGLLWLFAQATDLAIGLQVAAVGMLQAAFLAVLGWQVCRRLLFPLLLLWLMVPVGDLLVPRLIELTTALTVGGLRLAGMNVVVDGNQLVADGARYAIIQECSGLDFLLGNLLVALVFANLVFRSTSRKLAYVLAAVPVAIGANILRTTTVVLLTAAGVDLAADHEAYGWFLFLVAMLGQMAVGARYREAAGPVTAGTLSPLPAPGRVSAVAAGFVLVAALAPAAGGYLLPSGQEPTSARVCLPPLGGQAPVAGGWRPDFPRADATVHRMLQAAGRPVDLYVAYFGSQGPGRELVSAENRLHDGAVWRYLADGHGTVRYEGRDLAVASQRLAGPDGRQRLVWYWYRVDGEFTGSAVTAKLLQARAVLARGDRSGALIAVALDEGGDAAADRAALQAALDGQPGLGRLIDEVARGNAPGHPCAESGLLAAAGDDEAGAEADHYEAERAGARQ